MQLNSYIKKALLVGLAGGFMMTLGQAQAQERVRWKLASSYASTLAELGQNIVRVLDNVKTMSDGKFDIKFYEPNALVPALGVFDAVSVGSVDASYTSAGFHAGKLPHVTFFGSVPFGPGVNEYLAWMVAGSGAKLYAEEYAKYNVKGMLCGIVVAESSGWFRKEINTLDDLKGLKMRFYGLGGKAMQKLGVSTQLLSPGDIYPALELGSIDATEFSYPSLDKNLGFYQIAKHNYFPGWHQQASTLEIIVNMDKWNALSPANQKILEIACGEANVWSMAQAEAAQGAAVAFHESKGVTIHKWPPEFIEAFRQAWDETAAEEAAKDENFKRIYDAYTAFRAEYAKWGDVGYLK